MLPELQAAPPEASSRALAWLTGSHWGNVYSPASLIASRIQREVKKLRSSYRDGGISSGCSSEESAGLAPEVWRCLQRVAQRSGLQLSPNLVKSLRAVPPDAALRVLQQVPSIRPIAWVICIGQ